MARETNARMAAVAGGWSRYRSLSGRVKAVVALLVLLFGCWACNGLWNATPSTEQPTAAPMPLVATSAPANTVQPRATTEPEPTNTMEPPTDTAEPPTAVPVQPTEPPAPTQPPAPPTEPPQAPPPPTDAPLMMVSGPVDDLASEPPDDQPWLPCARGQVKGNRNSMIYHTPGGAFYQRTFRNVYCFNSAAEAEAAGYRASER